MCGSSLLYLGEDGSSGFHVIPLGPQFNTHFANYFSYIAPIWLYVNTENNWSCCPKNWKSFHSNCYFISTETKNWTESEKNCSGMEAHLLVINTKAEEVLSSK